MSNSPIDSRPWRKRHPVLSRVVLFGIAALVVGTLLFLKQQRADQVHLTELRAELASFDLLMGTPNGPEIVLQLLDEKFVDPGLPADLRGQALRWEAMALRRLARAGDADAARRVEPTYERAMALTSDADLRRGLTLEFVEARLERDDGPGALALLDAGDFPAGPWALLREQYKALAGEGDAGQRLEQVLDRLEAPLALEPSVSVGGRTWNLPEVATVTTERLARLYKMDGRSELDLWHRLSELVALHARSQVICAQHLVALGDDEGAARAWARAVRTDPEEARAWAENDEALAALDARSQD